MDDKPRLLDQMRDRIRLKHYSIRTERVYCEWVKRFIRFHRYRHPPDMGAAEIEASLRSCRAAKCVGIYSKLGIVVSLQGSIGAGFAVVSRYCSGEEASAIASGIDCR